MQGPAAAGLRSFPALRPSRQTSGGNLDSWDPAGSGRPSVSPPAAAVQINTRSGDTPSIVVLDELPWLAEQDDRFDSSLQTAWDRLLAGQSAVLVLLGSHLHTRERLTAYDRPFFGRADNLVRGPLNAAETGAATGLDAGDAIDAHLVSCGLPGILRGWPHATPALSFIEQECADPASPLFGVPESTLLAEFPSPDQAKPVLYRIAGSNLRLYLAAMRAAHEQARRGRPEAAFRLMQRRWATWRT